MPEQRWQVTGPQTLLIDDPITRLKVRAVAGHLNVIASDEATTRVEVTKFRGRPLELVLRDGELTVHYPSIADGGIGASLQWMMAKALADISIAVPRGAAMDLASVSGELFVAGSEGELRASTVSGRLIVDGAEGEVRGRTVSGDLVGRGLAGACNLSTVSGSITATGAIDRVTLDAVSGDVTLDTSVPTVDVTASTVSGNVTVRRPSGAPLHSRISTMSGKQVIEQGADDAAACRINVTAVTGQVTLLESDPGTAADTGPLAPANAATEVGSAQEGATS